MNKVQKHKNICEDLTEIYEKKNADYGQKLDWSDEDE